MYVDYAETEEFQSVKTKVQKCQIDTLNCALEKTAAFYPFLPITRVQFWRKQIRESFR